MTASRKSRTGITLIEIVVVLGMLMLLAAFAIPMFFRFRTDAVRQQGANNLRTLVIALHGHSDAYKRMPPAVGLDPQGSHGSIFFHLLPFIEQAELRRNVVSVWERGVISTPVAVYLDPHDHTAPTGNTFEGWLATTSYAVNWQAVRNGEKGVGNGFPDGTSNTILFGQRYQVC